MLDDFPAPKLRIYPRYTVIAEKFEASIRKNQLEAMELNAVVEFLRNKLVF